MHAIARGRSQLAHRARSVTGLRRRRGLCALVGLGLVATACGGSSEATSGEPRATFARAEGNTLQFQEPVATVADLMAPGAEDAPWTIVGSIYDPDAGTSLAATWESADGQSWEREDLAPADGDVSESFSAVTNTEDGRLAVGWVGDGAASDAALWREQDGEWRRGDIPELGGEHEQWAFDVVVNDGGILVAGGESVWGEVRARMWFSEDGESWETVDGGPGGPFDATGQESVREVTAMGAGFVAVGSRNVDSEQDGLAWYSDDGRSWQQLDAPTLGGPGRQAVTTVATVGDVVVAGGYSVGLNGQGRPVVWRSRDGQTWGETSDALPLHDDARSAAADMAVRSLSVDGETLVAAGGSDWRPQIWRSGDAGATWELLPNPVGNGLFLDGVALEGAASRGDTTLAIGLEPTVLQLNRGRWQDATGDSFPKGGEQPFVGSAAAGDEATVVAGGRYRSPEGDTRERYVGQVWHREGDSWTAIDTDALAAGQMMDVVPYAGGFVAVGFEDFSEAKKRTAGNNSSPDGLIWTSADGREWERISARIPEINQALLPVFAENESDDIAGAITETAASQPLETSPPAGGPGTQALEAVAPLGDGFIAVGVTCCQDPGEPLVVVSGDGAAIQGENADFGGPGTQRFRDVCVSPDGVAVAVGISGTDGDYDIAVRRRDAEGQWARGKEEGDDESFRGAGSQQVYGCAASDEGFVLVGSDDRSGDSDARTWTSEDGVTWTRVTDGVLGGAGDQWASAAAAVPDGGWLVGGTDTAAGDGDLALWRLASDGSISRRDRGEPELAGPGEQSASDITIDEEGRVVITGDDYGRVGLWESDDLDR